ncbi:MAG TPA: phosphatidate cytidylyltransferase [Firmicutes bacterium]|jgi:phosphatidate cytidylyltransferase|nr:phosphatidate cytidylyltransferase [Bacillota bacterium]
MLRQRLFAALIAIPLVLALSWVGGTLFFLAVCILGILALHEFYSMCQITGRFTKGCGYFGCLLLLTAAWLGGINWLLAALIFFFLLLNTCWIFLYPFDFKYLAAVLWGQLYIPFLLSFFILLRSLENGFFLLFSAILATWASDSGAYFFGLALGRHKMLPAVSPKKSWEGAIGGLLAAAVVIAVFAPYFSLDRPAGFLLGLFFSLAGQIGDLAESALKRWANKKDSGKFLPGHGGFLDRLDSLLFAVPLAYFVYVFLF